MIDRRSGLIDRETDLIDLTSGMIDLETDLIGRRSGLIELINLKSIEREKFSTFGVS